MQYHFPRAISEAAETSTQIAIETSITEASTKEQPVAPESIMPLMDGSTSAAPLEAGIRSEYEQIAYIDALS